MPEERNTIQVGAAIKWDASTDNKITVDDYIQWLQNAPHEIKTEKNPTKTPQKSQKIDQSIKSSQGSASTETAPTKKTRGGL